MTGRPARGAEDEKGKRGPSEWAQRASERAPRSRTSPTLRPRSAGGGQPAERAECGEPVDGRTRWALSSPGAPQAGNARGEEGEGSGGGGGGGTPRTDVAVEVESCTATVTGCVSVCASFLRSLPENEGVPHSFLLRILLSCSPWRNIWPTSSGQRRTGSTVPSISRLVRGLRLASSSRRRRRRRLNCIGVVPPVPHACASPDNDRIVSTRRSLLPSS